MSGGTSDKEFYKTFGIVSLIIVLLAVVIAALSNIFASSVTNDYYDRAQEKATSERIAPSGKVNLASNPTFKTQVIEVATAKSGKDVYDSVCMSCHMSGAAGAPITGETNQWSTRLAKGNATLYSNAINGIGVMPAKGGLMSLSEDEVKLAVDYMIDQSK